MTAGIAGDFDFDWKGSRTDPASDLVSVGSFVGWRLVEVLGCCAARDDRN